MGLDTYPARHSVLKGYENQHDGLEVITSVQTNRPVLIGSPPSLSGSVFEPLVKTLPIL